METSGAVIESVSRPDAKSSGGNPGTEDPGSKPANKILVNNTLKSLSTTLDKSSKECILTVIENLSLNSIERLIGKPPRLRQDLTHFSEFIDGLKFCNTSKVYTDEVEHIHQEIKAFKETVKTLKDTDCLNATLKAFNLSDVSELLPDNFMNIEELHLVIPFHEGLKNCLDKRKV